MPSFATDWDVFLLDIISSFTLYQDTMIWLYSTIKGGTTAATENVWYAVPFCSRYIFFINQAVVAQNFRAVNWNNGGRLEEGKINSKALSDSLEMHSKLTCLINFITLQASKCTRG